MHVACGIGLPFLLLATLLPLTACAQTNPIKHVIVIVQENHTFDNYFGTYPGASGINNSIALPAYPNSSEFIQPFHLDSAVPPIDLNHERQTALGAFDNGKMDGFVYAEKSNLTLGYFDYRELPYYWDYASQFVLADNYYSSAMGPSLPNHIFLLAGQSGGILDNTDNVTINFPCIIDELETKGLSWKYYGVNASFHDANPLPAFLSFKNNPSRFTNCLPTNQFYSDIAQGRLADVVLIRSEFFSEHPPQNVTAGQNFVVSLVNSVMQSSYWSSTAILITWDDYGGWYDHAAPPQVDEAGYGFRVPLLIISPYAKTGFVDHVLNDHTSILKLLETTFALKTLANRDERANNLSEAFDFSQIPRKTLVLPGEYVPDHYPLTPRTENNGTALAALALGSTIAFLAALFLVLMVRKRKHSGPKFSQARS